MARNRWQADLDPEARLELRRQILLRELTASQMGSTGSSLFPAGIPGQRVGLAPINEIGPSLKT